MNAGYNLGNYGLRIRTIIDVGVLYGTDWLYAAFPRADILLIDPLPEVHDVPARYPRRTIKCAQYAAGSQPGKHRLQLIRKPDGSLDGRTGLLTRTPLTKVEIYDHMTVKVDTVDRIIRRHKCHPPYLLKIDTEGFEARVLLGARSTLADTECVIAEVPTKRRFNQGPRASRLFSILGRAGFELFKVLGGNGPRNNYYDMMFVKFSHKMFDKTFER